MAVSFLCPVWGKSVWTVVACLVISALLAVDAYAFGSVEAPTGCMGHNTSSVLGSEDEGAKMANRKFGRTLLQDSSEI
jgi:hypothetical protein